MSYKLFMLKTDDVVQARIICIEEYGLFLQYHTQKIFITVPELSWNPLSGGHKKHFAVGKTIKIKILHWVEERQYFVGSIRALYPEKNPWREPLLYQKGTKHIGTVYSIATFGYFIKLPPGGVGLLHKGNTNKQFAIGDTVRVVIESVDNTIQKIGLLES